MDAPSAIHDHLPPKPWSDRLVLDANVSPPVSEHAHGESHTSLNGDVTTGYHGDRFGFVARGDSTYYTLDAAKSSALTERYSGGVDLWGVVDLHPTVRLEPRLSAGAIYYGTLADETTATGSRQTNQDSLFARGVGSVGLRVHGSRFDVAGSFGAGYQYEDYFHVAQTFNGEQRTVFDAASTIRLEGSVHARVELVRGVVSFRGRGSVSSFSMRRSDSTVTFKAGEGGRSDEGVTEIAQTEIFARGFLDADAARFFGFVPTVHFGANVFLSSSDAGSTSAVVPVLGIGVLRETL